MRDIFKMLSSWKLLLISYLHAMTKARITVPARSGTDLLLLLHIPFSAIMALVKDGPKPMAFQLLFGSSWRLQRNIIWNWQGFCKMIEPLNQDLKNYPCGYNTQTANFYKETFI